MSELEREDLELEAALRPKDLSEFVGQQRVVDQLSLVIAAAKKDNRSADHIPQYSQRAISPQSSRHLNPLMFSSLMRSTGSLEVQRRCFI